MRLSSLALAAFCGLAACGGGGGAHQVIDGEKISVSNVSGGGIKRQLEVNGQKMSIVQTSTAQAVVVTDRQAQDQVMRGAILRTTGCSVSRMISQTRRSGSYQTAYAISCL